MKLLLGLFLVSAVGVGASPIAHFYSEGIRHVGDSQTHTFSQSSIRNDDLGVNIENERHSYTDNSLSMSHVDAPPGSVIVNGNNRLHRRPTGRNGAVIVNGQGNVIGPDVQGSDGLRLNHRAPRDIRIEDNRIDVTNLQTHGSAQIFIGHGRRQRDVVEPVNEQTENGREKRSYDYRNTNIQYNDRRVTMRNVQAGSGSVIVAGNGNSIGKRSVDTEPINGSPEETDKTREKRWSVGVKGRFSHTHNENISHKQHDIRAGDYAIITNGDGNQFHNRRKRLVESVSDQKVDSTTNIPTTRENVTETSETPETSTRQKRWFVRGSVKHSHTHTENRNHYQSNVRAGDYAIITNGDGNQFHNRRKRLVESVSAQDSSALTLEDPESLSRQRRWFVRASAKHDHTHNQNKNHHQSDVRAGDYAIITNGDGNHFHNRRRRSEDSVQTESEDTKRGYLARSKRHFRGAVHIVDRRTRPGPQVSLDNLHGEGSVQIIIDDNTDPVTLRNARVIGSAQILIG